MGLQTTESKTYLSVLGSDGSIRQQVDEYTEGAVRREYETSDGKTGEKWELKFNAISGMVEDVAFYEGDYGTNILITIKDEDDNEYVLSLNASTPFGEDFMLKLPNIDQTKEVEFKPYSFKDRQTEKVNRGLRVTQDDEKVMSYFTEVTEKDGKKTYKSLHGIPEPDARKKYNSEKWKTFFAQRREWLMDYLIDNELVKSAEVSEDKEGEEF